MIPSLSLSETLSSDSCFQKLLIEGSIEMGVEIDSSSPWWWVPLCFTFLASVASVLFYVFLFRNRTNNCGNDSPSSIIGNQPGYEYEVFLSFRGPDTRKGFTDHLYRALIDAGIRAYRDDEELRKGEEIGPELLAAIKQSKVAVPIFSKDYASSKWCLKEVAQMLECRNKMGQVILPVFYFVAPNEVRHQTGDYGKSFSRHAWRYDADTIQQWRDALAAVGALKGWDVENTANG